MSIISVADELYLNASEILKLYDYITVYSINNRLFYMTPAV